MSHPAPQPAAASAPADTGDSSCHGNKVAKLVQRGAVLLSRYPHVPQAGRQDCGIACLRMVLRGLAVPQAEAALADALLASGLGQSVWSPDLLRLLLHCGLRARLYSRQLLPNPEYARLNYYRDEFNSDQQRVATNLAWIRQQHPGAALQESLPISAVLDHLTAGLGPVICLIDAAKTDAAIMQFCLQCQCLSSPLPGCCSSDGYQGHYILLCGCAPRDSLIIYRDPVSRRAEYKCMSYREFDRVRTAYGTDEDLIFVFETPAS